MSKFASITTWLLDHTWPFNVIRAERRRTADWHQAFIDYREQAERFYSILHKSLPREQLENLWNEYDGIRVHLRKPTGLDTFQLIAKYNREFPTSQAKALDAAVADWQYMRESGKSIDVTYGGWRPYGMRPENDHE